ncbi:gamma-glutamylcyclotransferase family protein [Ottowia sp.]|uniref:gamma-glutamylcyclotransferase family protein n=1 Tax=Ottowia sp. TaxID=1898956 RepID=UPI002D113991|nr:gamma-glutamylcyclotransferase family protein [Ottowia sp.]HOB66763.1 gamma-glutamylcyclotransferase [Ottowia sp.]HPZ58793.1 gamma-glutamylcyclotransferase [Ottowia sp.]HQD48090.1 gamma-glutamylcyclotransferase [Ottowia sp.]
MTMAAAPFDSFADRAPPVTHVFVYGTLRRGEANDITRLRPAPAFVGTAQVAGTLYDLGAYPGVVLGGASVVHGEVYAIQPALERRLDEIECVYPEQTNEYFKRDIAVSVCLPGGGRRETRCICYEYNPTRLGDARVIDAGDWVVPRITTMRK